LIDHIPAAFIEPDPAPARRRGSPCPARRRDSLPRSPARSLPRMPRPVARYASSWRRLHHHRGDVEQLPRMDRRVL